jgi:electron transfer flavoprotein beta subunit
MRLVVPVKQVARIDDDEALLADGSGVDPDALEHELNEWDTFSVEAALQLAGEGDEVVVVTVGTPEAEEALLSCLAQGADRGIRVWDERLGDLDPLATARVLAAAVERESPDLVLCGVQSSDGVNGATGVALAAHLGLPRVAVVKAIEREGEGLLVDRELEGGLLESVRVPIPALLTVQTGINEPRYATLRAIKQAANKPLDVLDLDALGLDPETVASAAGSRTRRLMEREAGEGAEMLSGSPEDVAARIAEIIQEATR